MNTSPISKPIVARSSFAVHSKRAPDLLSGGSSKREIAASDGHRFYCFRTKPVLRTIGSRGRQHSARHPSAALGTSATGRIRQRYDERAEPLNATRACRRAAGKADIREFARRDDNLYRIVTRGGFQRWRWGRQGGPGAGRRGRDRFPGLPSLRAIHRAWPRLRPAFRAIRR
jgi:hypothetical protein